MSVANVGLTPQTPFMTNLPPMRVDWHRMASEALDRLRAQSEIDAKNARLRLLSDLTKSAASHIELNDLFKKVTAGVRGVIRSDFALAGLLDSETGQLHVHAFDLPDYILLDEEARSVLEDALSERVLSSGKSSSGKPWVGKTEEFANVASQDGAEDAVEEDRKWAGGFKNVCALPLVSRDRVLGIFALGRRDETSYTHDEVDFLTQVSILVAVAIENALVNSELRKLKENASAESASLENEIPGEREFEEIVGKSAALHRVLREVKVVAPTDSGILIQGETGTGKELIARAIHNMSARRDRPFIKLNCAAIPSGLLESELFGHEKGAFTGAIMRKAGRFEVADKGTLFLDEVGDIPLEVQSKLLRVLQEQEFERLGSTRTQKVDVRVIAATHRDLKQMVEDGKFRRDLFYRLHVFPMLVPPLRDRREDIPMLVRHYVEKYAKRMNRRIETIPSNAMEVFVNYSWPGNVRELQNFIERAVILSPGSTLRPPLDELLDDLKGAIVPNPPAKLTTLEEVEREHVLRAIRESNWIIGGPNGAAARLGMKRTTLTYRIRKLNISRRPL
jgi:formate hydrogenlyase transcriptional activator